MKISKLCKIELYRFFHSMEIVKYFVIAPVVLFSMCYVNIFSVRNDISTSAIWGSMSSVYMYMIATMCVLISIYVGREYHYKTINYEVIKGYDICKIAVTKTVTCGIMVPIVYTICMLVYLMILTDYFSSEFLFRIILLCVVHIHICSSTTLYVMLCKSGILGGIVAFARFFLGDAIGQMLIGILGIETIERYIEKVQIFNQWNALINIECSVETASIFFIIAIALIEYGCLQFLLRMSRKHFDFM